MNSFLSSKNPVFNITLFVLSLAVISPGKADNAESRAYSGKPYGGTAKLLPGIIQAESYDVSPGNEKGIAYNRHGDPRPGTARTTGDCIGLATIGSDHVSTTGEKQKTGDVYVGWTDVGDWWKYTVNVKEAGTYHFGGHFAAGAKGAKISVMFTPLDAAGAAVSTGAFEVPTTAGYQPGVEVYHVWETLDNLAEITLKPGFYVMTIKVEAIAGLNIDYYTLTRK